jgi:hypothetical protein
MVAIIRQISFTISSLIFVYGILIVVSLLLYPLPDNNASLDSAHADDTVFSTDAKYVFLNRAPLSIKRDNVILLGASNVLVGFRQAELERLLSGVSVHNLAVGGSNITQDRQVFELAREMIAPEQLRRSIFVIGVWYGTLVPDATMWNTPDRISGDTDIDIERYRYGFDARTSQGPLEIVRPGFLQKGLVAVYPFIVADRLARDMTLTLREHLLNRHVLENRTDAERNAAVTSARDKADAIAYWRRRFGKSPIGSQQFEVLEKTVDEILGSGGRVLVVNLPIPRWHSDVSPYYREYKERWSDFVALADGKYGATTLDMSGLDNDSEFSDEVHPKPRSATIWDKTVAGALKPIINQLPRGGGQSMLSLHRLTQCVVEHQRSSSQYFRCRRD